MRLAMIVSANGYFSADGYSWATQRELEILRTFTEVDGPLLAGRPTFEKMSGDLRTVWSLSLNGSGILLASAAARYPGAWLMGGPTIAREALERDLVSQAVLIYSSKNLFNGTSANVVDSALKSNRWSRIFHHGHFGEGTKVLVCRKRERYNT